MQPLAANLIFILMVGFSLVGCATAVAISPVDNMEHSNATQTTTTAASTLSIITVAGTQSFTLDELQAALPTATLTIDDPVYKRTKTYEGFWLIDVLAYTNLLDDPGDMILFRAADGYETRLDVTQLNQAQPQGLIAFRDVEAEGDWEPFTRGKAEIIPAPYYLVWGMTEEVEAGKEQPVFPWREWPWPYQLVEIEMIDFATTYDRLYPPEIVETATAQEGFKLFVESCLKCHSMNLQGGDKGPELNIPQNITGYRDHETLMAFIKNPSAFRAGSAMPPMETKYTDEEIETILTYIAWMADYKWQDAE